MHTYNMPYKTDKFAVQGMRTLKGRRVSNDLQTSVCHYCVKLDRNVIAQCNEQNIKTEVLKCPTE